MIKYRERLRANIAAELGRNDISQRVAATQLDLSQGAFSSRMAGKTDFKIGELLLLSLFLEVSLSTLVKGLDVSNSTENSSFKVAV